jgi:hypothetical protein
MLDRESQECFVEIAISNYQKKERNSGGARTDILEEDPLLSEELVEGSEYIYL